jgi:hypothetical protein
MADSGKKNKQANSAVLHIALTAWTRRPCVGSSRLRAAIGIPLTLHRMYLPPCAFARGKSRFRLECAAGAMGQGPLPPI